MITKILHFAWKKFKTTLKSEYMLRQRKSYEDEQYSFIEPNDRDKFCRKYQSPQNMKKAKAIGKVDAKL
uniref:Uncharacterized protein n=1 Tax=Tanacetum cinerariifolium TaxID=118510 RepID=A0A6L2MKF1_TANCI|nr:hypothetical protein [Tanacetum cinerariifolium]